MRLFCCIKTNQDWLRGLNFKLSMWNISLLLIIKMAGSIKLFSFNRKFSHVIGIHPTQLNQNGPSIKSRNWIVIISFALLALSSAAFFVFEAKSMLDYGLSFLAASASACFVCIYLVMIWQMKNTSAFIENCERFIEKRVESIIAYRELIEKIELLCKSNGIASIISAIFVTVPFLLYTLINSYIFDLGEESFVLLFPVKWPFNWKRPLGYFVAWLAQSAGVFAVSILSPTLLNLILGSCLIFIVMAEDATRDLESFNKAVKSDANRAESAVWAKRFCEVIQLYSDAKQCVNEFNRIVKFSLFSLLFFLMLSVSSSLVTLQFEFLDENAKLLDTIMVSIIALWIFGMLFLPCELGERMTHHFDIFHKNLDSCDWHTLPIEMQRMYLIFLSDTQQPKKIACYGNVLCIRETFKKITNKGFSYFMTLRRFDA